VCLDGFKWFKLILHELLNNFVRKNSTKSKLFLLKKLVCTLGIVGKPLMSEVSPR
jgi:hypothetical protein